MSGGTGAGSAAAGASITAYATYDQVKAMCPRRFNVTANAPTQANVNDWLEQGAQYLDAKLSSAGYTTPVTSGTAAYTMLTNLNTLFAAAMVENAYSVDVNAATGQSRGETLEMRFWKGVDNLLKLDLSGMGVTHTCHAYAGGISLADKDAVEDDSDRTPLAFRRGMHAYPGAGTTDANAPSDPQERSD